MKGLLQRLAARAGGRSEGLRPRVTGVFERAADAVPDAGLTEVQAFRAAPVASRGAGDATGATRPVSPPATFPAAPEPPLPPQVEPRAREISAPRASLAPGSPSTIAPPRAPGAPSRVRAAARATAQEVPTAPAVTTRKRDAAPAAAAPVPGSTRVPRSPLTFETTVPRAVARDEPARAGDARRDDRARGAGSAEPVVRVTIERLDVHAVAPAEKPRRPRGAGERPDTLAEYARKRRESTR